MELGLSLSRRPKPAGPPDLAARFLALSGGPATYVHPDETYLTAAQGKLLDLTVWTAQTGAPTFQNGEIRFPASSTLQVARVQLAQSIPAGSRARVTFRCTGPDFPDRARVRPKMNTDLPSSGYIQRTGWWSHEILTTAARSFVDFQCPGDSLPAYLTDVCVQVIDPAQQAYDILLVWGQSNMTGASAGARPDPDLDLPHPKIDMLMGHTNAAFYAVEGEITGARDALPFRALNDSVSPAMAFARHYADHVLAPGRRLLLICAAEGGTTLADPITGNWHPDNTLPAAEDHYGWMLGQAQTALALNPANSVVAALGSQGESDRGVAGHTQWAQAMRLSFVPALRTALARADLPFIQLGLNPGRLSGPVDQNTLNMLATQETLDSLSGDANALADYLHCPWRAEWGNGTKADPDDAGDEVHFGPMANRLRGVDAAIRARARFGW